MLVTGLVIYGLNNAKQEESTEDVPKVIEEEIPDVPHIMNKIAYCESGNKQFNSEGAVIMSPTSDVGIYQINWVHWERAEELGIDLWTEEGNTRFAKILYNQAGTTPWYQSEHCWSIDNTT